MKDENYQNHLPKEDGWHHVGVDFIGVGSELMDIQFLIISGHKGSWYN